MPEVKSILREVLPKQVVTNKGLFVKPSTTCELFISFQKLAKLVSGCFVRPLHSIFYSSTPLTFLQYKQL
uniref:Uncharacterized protein n=1 Tax=Monopterus albus TaxID=43700 RepID=A0A3Q3IF25_MONAL